MKDNHTTEINYPFEVPEGLIDKDELEDYPGEFEDVVNPFAPNNNDEEMSAHYTKLARDFRKRVVRVALQKIIDGVDNGALLEKLRTASDYDPKINDLAVSGILAMFDLQ